VAKGAGSFYSTAYKMDHDIEQLEYLATKLDGELLGEEILKVGLPLYRRVRAKIPSLEALATTQGLYAFEPEDLELMKHWYNRALYVPTEDTIVGSLLDNEKDWSSVEKEYFKNDVCAVDDVLTPAAFDAIRELLMSSTVFYETKMPQVFGGYVGAIIEDGLHAKPLLRLARELRAALPNVLGDHSLRYLWVYKYDSNFKGIKVHADEAAVNFNLWLTPDDANLDKTNGGLVVYVVKPPETASIEDYNQRGPDFAMELLQQSDYQNVTVPYKANRAVIFDSALFHKSDSFHFKSGYQHRRINLTLLFGSMRKAPDINHILQGGGNTEKTITGDS